MKEQVAYSVNLVENVKLTNERIASALTRSRSDQLVKIIAVTKTHPAVTIVDVYKAGLFNIGENRIQEAEKKFSELPSLQGLQKRMIGHLQSNKVNKAIELFDKIDSVDSIKLANKISNAALAINKKSDVLLEVNTSGEKTKFGFNPEDIEELLTCIELPGLKVQGLMTIGPLTQDTQQVRKAFVQLRELFDLLNNQRSKNMDLLTELSMGMSGDFELAIEEGSTMVRLGTVLFGPRKPYP
ncbi:YggS family pyridoxal phosphate-dependent enzyme [Candidatus Neomarinimicrobiota bacterium]